jgi:hypothetical protein
MNLLLENNLLKLSGVINEQTPAGEIAQKLKEASAVGPRVRVDMSGVPRCNSIGIWAWLKAIRDAGNPPITYVNCPPWLVDQFNMMREFLVGDVVVEDIQVPFYNESTDEIVIQLLKIGSDIPVQGSYDEFVVPQPVEGCSNCELAIDPDIYFAFLTRYPSAG